MQKDDSNEQDNEKFNEENDGKGIPKYLPKN